MEKAAKMMADLRSDVPKSIGGATVTGVRDYKSVIATDLLTGAQSVIPLPKSNVLEFLLGQKGSVIARPSGTEPLIRVMAEASDEETCKKCISIVTETIEELGYSVK
jgi:phosphomannomutase